MKPLDALEQVELLFAEVGEEAVFEDVEERLMASPAVHRYVLAAGYSMLAAQRRHEARTRIKKAPPRHPKTYSAPARHMAVVKQAERSLYTEFMIGNTPLGKVTYAQLHASCEADKAKADGLLQSHAFKAALLAKMKADDMLTPLEQQVPVEVAYDIRTSIFCPNE